MKKSFKLIALFLAIAMLSVSLCSCRDLDDKKENRAVYTSADHKEIEYKGNIYRQINLGKYNFLSYYMGGMNTYYVTDKDVPVLLTSQFGNWMVVDGNENHIEVSDYDKGELYYVRDDLYDKVKELVASGKLDCYYLEYWDEIDYDNLEWDEYDTAYEESYHMVMVDDAVAKVVNNAENAANNDKISYKKLSPNYQDIIELIVCDSDMILTDVSPYHRLVKDKNNYYYWSDNSIGEYCLVPLNEEDSQIIAKLFSDYPDAISAEKVSWQYENEDDYYDYNYDYSYDSDIDYPLTQGVF